MPIRFYLIVDRKLLKLDVVRVEGDVSRMPAYACPPNPDEPKDIIPLKPKKNLEDKKRKQIEI